MKVHELISLLSNVDKDAEVFVTNYWNDTGMAEYNPESVRDHFDDSGKKDGAIVLSL